MRSGHEVDVDGCLSDRITRALAKSVAGGVALRDQLGLPCLVWREPSSVEPCVVLKALADSIDKTVVQPLRTGRCRQR